MAPTLRDDQLEQEAQSLRDGYLAESTAKLAAAQKEFDDALAAMNSAANEGALAIHKTVAGLAAGSQAAAQKEFDDASAAVDNAHDCSLGSDDKDHALLSFACVIQLCL